MRMRMRTRTATNLMTEVLAINSRRDIRGAEVIKWARRKFKRMRHQTKGARTWFDRFRRANS
jgi:hypothetical protein